MELDPYIVNFLFDGGVSPETVYFLVGMHLLVAVGVLLSLVFDKGE